ncbi:1-(5-phosphoribosyl)-5-[(5-phosphoribosylamino)methylideneamino]imidazole-4-carboxamide isomerase [Eubacteriales bacterium OttesenSCG-928-K08]|nr:1-(5-phosphoribosyl)-5-[(5-phosphoribosylamino)methylideneamino]imidazole-4-carboxamide isomerase [Eubacteriales bacterium OttesenSCG-928-K08]
MELFPAVDIRGGQVVRLFQGDYDQMQVYGNSPRQAAENFKEQKARNLHVVDLDGAKDGTQVNLNAIKEICEIGGLFVEVGGGIRDENAINRYLDIGVGRVILGTVAVRDFPFVEKMVAKYGDKIAVGVDARDGKVAVSGWLETTDISSLEFCRRISGAGVKTVIYTDIAKDGGLNGTNLDAYRALREIDINVIASGGISFEHEITALRDMGTYGAIVGKAIYVNRLDLSKLILLADGEE